MPAPLPAALQALDAGLAAILLVLRALVAGHLPGLPVLPGTVPLPAHAVVPAAPRRSRLECVAIGAAPGRRYVRASGDVPARLRATAPHRFAGAAPIPRRPWPSLRSGPPPRAPPGIPARKRARTAPPACAHIVTI